MNLLGFDYADKIKKTALTRKITLGGVTKVYPVYSIPVGYLFYNDQNDRIATWITQYKTEHGADVFEHYTTEERNQIIENFIIESNPNAIEKTKMNISLVGQREPGVVLSDGRIIDGNRRFTCLRQLHREEGKEMMFEAVILDADLEDGRKQIKRLELEIQHGEEKKVDYNPIDRIVGAYQDIIETRLLTIDEYAESTNESVNDVKKRLELGNMVVEFLEFIHMPKQYHVAREKQVVSIFTDLQPLLKKCKSMDEVKQLKETVFCNIMMDSIGDGRKYINNVNQMMSNGYYKTYIKEQEKIRDEVKEKLENETFKTVNDLNMFVRNNESVSEELALSTDATLLKARRREVREKPSQQVSKSISMIQDVDLKIIDKLDDNEVGILAEKLDKLKAEIATIEKVISVRNNQQ